MQLKEPLEKRLEISLQLTTLSKSFINHVLNIFDIAVVVNNNMAELLYQNNNYSIAHPP
ncbi:hypothetical protein D3C80_1723270 [compost metagenome]